MGWKIHKHYTRIQKLAANTGKPHYTLYNGEWRVSQWNGLTNYLLIATQCKTVRELQASV